jgi:hypothetical protein
MLTTSTTDYLKTRLQIIYKYTFMIEGVKSNF